MHVLHDVGVHDVDHGSSPSSTTSMQTANMLVCSLCTHPASWIQRVLDCDNITKGVCRGLEAIAIVTHVHLQDCLSPGCGECITLSKARFAGWVALAAASTSIALIRCVTATVNPCLCNGLAPDLCKGMRIAAQTGPLGDTGGSCTNKLFLKELHHHSENQIIAASSCS